MSLGAQGVLTAEDSMDTCRKIYAVPKIVSEQVFEQAALACSTVHYKWDGSAFDRGDRSGCLKITAERCGYHHS